MSSVEETIPISMEERLEMWRQKKGKISTNPIKTTTTNVSTNKTRRISSNLHSSYKKPRLAHQQDVSGDSRQYVTPKKTIQPLRNLENEFNKTECIKDENSINEKMRPSVNPLTILQNTESKILERISQTIQDSIENAMSKYVNQVTDQSVNLKKQEEKENDNEDFILSEINNNNENKPPILELKEETTETSLYQLWQGIQTNQHLSIYSMALENVYMAFKDQEDLLRKSEEERKSFSFKNEVLIQQIQEQEQKLQQISSAYEKCKRDYEESQQHEKQLHEQIETFSRTIKPALETAMQKNFELEQEIKRLKT